MAESKEVRFAQLYSLTYLPAYIVYEEKLIEKHATRLGIPAPKVTTNKLSSGPAANDALISGNVDIAMGGITVLLTLWDKTQGTMNVRGIATMVDSPIFLMTVDPRIKSLKDFGEGDRIAVSAVKVTMQALFLNLAAAREWGWDARFKLDPLTVSMSHPMSIQALRTGKLEVKSYAAIVPYNYEVHRGQQRAPAHDVLRGAGRRPQPERDLGLREPGSRRTRRPTRRSWRRSKRPRSGSRRTARQRPAPTRSGRPRRSRPRTLPASSALPARSPSPSLPTERS
jgi:NitT/TauT family transport system substrate-binding protein